MQFNVRDTAWVKLDKIVAFIRKEISGPENVEHMFLCNINFEVE